MEYILAVLALIATMVGILGKTSKSGRPTLLGWVAGSVALLVCVLTVVQHFNKQREERKIAVVAYTKVLRSVHGLVTPFAIMVADIDLKRMVPGTGPTPVNKRVFAFSSAREDQLVSKDLLSIYELLPQLLQYEAILRSYTLADRTSVLGQSSPRWSELFQRTALRALQELDPTMSTYRSVMDSSAVAAVERLRGAWLVQRITHLSESPPETSLGGFLHLFDAIPGAPAPIYKDFLSAAESAHRLCREKLEAAAR